MIGHIQGIRVGQIFPNRRVLHDANVHRGLRQGIAPDGSSIVLASGYVDDQDAECCHITPLGKPHNGPDTLDNVLCLCANCHVLFDMYALSIQNDLFIPETGNKLVLRSNHKKVLDYIEYHRKLGRQNEKS